MGLVVLNQALFIALFNSCVTAFAENRTTAAIADKMIRANRAIAQTAAKAFSDAAFIQLYLIIYLSKAAESAHRRRRALKCY